jgi:hypothetical protein
MRYFLHLHFKCYPESLLYPAPPLSYPPTPTSWHWCSPVLQHIQFASPKGLSFQWWPTRPSVWSSESPQTCRNCRCWGPEEINSSGLDGICELIMEAQFSTFNNYICKIRGFSSTITKSNDLWLTPPEKPSGQWPNDVHMRFAQSRCPGWFCVLELSQRKEPSLRKCLHEIQI